MTDAPMQLLPEPFTVTADHLDTGLRGIPVGTCRTSAVSPEQGVSYAGYGVRDLADLPCEQAIYLLFHKELPTESQAKAFSADLARRATVAPEVFTTLAALPASGHPMEWFITGIQLLGMTGKTKDNDTREDALNLVARISTLAAAIFRLKCGWGAPIPPRTDLTFSQNFVHMLGAPDVSPRLADVLRMFHVLHLDHDGGNLSTFTGKAIASGLADVYSAMGGAMAALYGPLHGRANQECLAFVKRVGVADEARVEEYIRKALASSDVIYGFGHAVLRAEDPRAAIQYDYAAQHFADDPNVRTAIALRKVVPPILKENPKIKDPYPNVDAISGSLLHAAGLRDPEFYTMLFGWSRVCGIAAQIVDERLVLRDGKGVPIYRPKFIATHQPPRKR